jgi:leucyl aminopeptidase
MDAAGLISSAFDRARSRRNPMKTSLPSIENLEINQSTAALSASRFESVAQLLLLVPKPAGRKLPTSLPLAGVIEARLRRGGWRKPPAHLSLELSNRSGTRVTVGFVEPGADAFTRLETTRKLFAAVRQEPSARVTVAFAELGDATADWADAVVTAASAAAFRLKDYKKTQDIPTPLKSVALLGLPRRQDFSRTLAAAAGTNLARWLAALPGNALTPASYRRLVAQLAKRHGWKIETLGQAALKRKGCGAFLAVVQGSPHADAAIVRLSYRPRGRADKGRIALVGKGICYDTGGVNLKPARYMFGMHEDMAGSATALGTLLALTALEPPFAVDCWLALAQNHIGPESYQPNDVVTACDGTTIEVVHTDAEGRMVLADTLALVARTRPDFAIDFATLTGSCVAALGTRYSGVFTNRDVLNGPLIQAGRVCGERVWPFPQDPDYDRALDSKVADIKQCSMDNDADHILGARFLSRFIGDATPWVHMDLSAASAKGGLGAVPTDSTGFGVRFTVEALLGTGILGVCKN